MAYLAKKLGNWIASWKCKVCGGTAMIEDLDDPEIKKPCMTCKKGWIYTSGHVTS